MSKVTGIVAFLAGAALGSGVTWYVVKTKYERIAQDEIDSVKEVFSKKRASLSDEKKSEIEFEQVDISEVPEENDPSEEDISEDKNRDYIHYINTNKYSSEEENVAEKPYVISPDEVGDNPEYPLYSLTYYADHILADDWDEIVEDVEETVGFESLTHFGEYEDDSVFVRNDQRACDYEILLDSRRYEDVRKNNPNLR